ncbi:hypothetical protein [Paractinoplanes brasiliensis]|uniref:hypothetical protein n=1 Tax=Paractinoplanes brasiliensis TaxID=52695 RepID=UPI001A63A3A9|nr:hypothetical protein [Actinoplanes brasiliensis]GID29012.1 hypothetical protein Abr02nite_39950 [Actinoplanes brasiliensis]
MTTQITPPGPVGSPRRLTGWAVAALAAVAAFGASLWSALNNDVTYALGGMETAGKTGVSIWDVFVARPVAYRLLLAVLDAPVAHAPLRVAHAVIRFETALLVVGVAAVLFFGMRRYLDVRAAAAVSAAAGLALIIAPQWHFLEPDWVAAMFAVLAVGAACAPRRVWVGALLGGFAAFLAIAVKLATVPITLLALVLVGVLSVRRAAWAAVAAAGSAVLWYAATKRFLPWEWTWLDDQANLVADSPIHHGLRWEDFHLLLVGLGDVALLSPVVAVAPAAAAALIRRLPPGRPRWIGAAVAVVAGGLSVASAYGQGEFYMYHYAVVPVLAAAVWGVAFALCPGARTSLFVTTVVFAVASFVLLAQPPEWRLDNVTPVSLSYLVFAVLAAVATWALERRATPLVPPQAGAIALTAALVLATLPNAPLAFSGYNYALSNERPSAPGYAALRERIGPDTPVLYLAFGSINYLLRNPSTCRYPSPQWVQRGAHFKAVRTYPSYRDNLRCLTEDDRAGYLVLQPSWFPWKKASPDVRTVISARFDCSVEARVPAPKGLVVCPARR